MFSCMSSSDQHPILFLLGELESSMPPVLSSSPSRITLIPLETQPPPARFHCPIRLSARTKLPAWTSSASMYRPRGSLPTDQSTPPSLVGRAFDMEVEDSSERVAASTAENGLASDYFGDAINKASRWAVVAIVVAVVLWRHDDQVAWAVTGSILNAGNSRLLKKIFNQQRPLSALGLKADPGMPSSHAQSLGYLSSYAVLGLISWQGIHTHTVAAATLILLCASYLAWLRISGGLHTPAQVLVGTGFGCITAGLWFGLWYSFFRKAIASSHVVRLLFLSTFGIAVICFFLLGVRKWRLGEA